MHINISADGAMGVITAVYVVATILIFIANYKSVKIAREQVAEMRHEFKENNRPRIEIELDLKQRVMYALKFVNRGAKTAYHVTIHFDDDFLESTRGLKGSCLLMEQIGKECIIGAGQHYEMFLFDVEKKEDETLLPVSGTIEYEADGERYSGDFAIDLKNYMSFFSSETEEEKLRKLIDKQNAEISRLNETISIVMREYKKRNC